MRVPSLGQEYPLEKEMAAHPSILAWKSPWTEETSRLQTTWPQRARHDSQNNPSIPDGPVVKNPPANAGNVGSVPGWGRSPGEGNGNLLQYSCLGNPMDRGAWWVTVRGVTKSWR